MLILTLTGYGQTASGTHRGDGKGQLRCSHSQCQSDDCPIEATNVTQQTAANSLGDFDVPFLPPGTYTVRVDFRGFQTLVRDGIVLQVGDVLRVDATLRPGKVGQEVTVTGLASLLETENGSTGQVIGTTQILDLPLADRNFLELTQLSADVTPGAHGTYNTLTNVALAQKGYSFSAQGQRDDATSFLLDGTNVRGSYSVNHDRVLRFRFNSGILRRRRRDSAQHGTSPCS